jgi:hypothetical protein
LKEFFRSEGLFLGKAPKPNIVEDSGNFFRDYFFANKGRLINKWHHYFEIYERHFSRYRGKDITFMEIGIYQGGSLELWKNYFGKNSKIYAIDINPACKAFEDDRVKVFIGSQEDRAFLRSVVAQIPKLDILLDDGGHTMRQQIVTFEEMFDHVQENGVFMCEDVHTSYWRKFGGGLRRAGTFIEYTKKFVDYLHALYPINGGQKVNGFARSAHSVHYYPGIVVVEKRKMETPVSSMTGTRSVEELPEKKRSLFRRMMGQP